jgi:hypothetical protein
MPDADPEVEKRDGPTPNGGVRSEAHYQDDAGAPAPKSKAVRVTILEFDAAGNVVWRTYGEINRGAS